jgi:F0F1-type ATP synthase assembly protein I
MKLGKLARQMGIAMEIPMAPLGGGLLGYFIDEYLGTGPIFTVILALLGIGVGVINIVRLAREFSTRS